MHGLVYIFVVQGLVPPDTGAWGCSTGPVTHGLVPRIFHILWCQAELSCSSDVAVQCQILEIARSRGLNLLTCKGSPGTRMDTIRSA